MPPKLPLPDSCLVALLLSLDLLSLGQLGVYFLWKTALVEQNCDVKLEESLDDESNWYESKLVIFRAVGSPPTQCTRLSITLSRYMGYWLCKFTLLHNAWWTP